jgi:hypothetical protein
LGGSNGGTLPRKWSGEFGPLDQITLRGMEGRMSDHAPLAVPDKNPNHHAVNESKAEIYRKFFLRICISMYGSAPATITRESGRSRPDPRSC